MTIASTTNKSGPYNCNGVTTDFAGEFKIADETHVKVIHADTGGVESVLDLDGGDYSVSGIGGDDFTVTISPALADGTITLVLDVPFTQDVDFENQGEFFAETVEEALDLGVQRDLQLQEQIDRSVKLPASADSSLLDTLVANIIRLTASIGNIDIVAAAITAVTTVATNIAAVIAAPAAATSAGNSATAAATSAGHAATSETNAANSAVSAAASAASVAPLATQINAATDTAFVSGDMLVARKAADGSLIKRSWGNLTSGLGAGLGALINGQLVTSTNAGKRTIAVKTLAGADPSPADPVKVVFRNATAGTGDYVMRSIEAALSVDISSTSTLDFVSGKPGRIWVPIIDDAGTVRLGVINCLRSADLSIYPLRDDVLVSSTAEGGAGAADSAWVIYTGTAVVAKAMRIAGYIDVTETTAGTWAAAVTKVQQFGPGVALPGMVVGDFNIETGGYIGGTNSPAIDNTIPQSGEGTLAMTAPSYSPTAAANIFEVQAQGWVGTNAGVTAYPSFFLLRDSGVDAVSAGYLIGQNGWFGSVQLDHRERVGSTAATQFKARFGVNTASSSYFNGQGGATFGGVMNSYIRGQEIQS